MLQLLYYFQLQIKTPFPPRVSLVLKLSFEAACLATDLMPFMHVARDA